MADIQRRDFLGMSLASVTAIGAIASLVAMKKTWDPLPSVVSAGFTTIDVANMQEAAVFHGGMAWETGLYPQAF